MAYVIANNVYATLAANVAIAATSIDVNKAVAPMNTPPDPSGGTGILTLVDDLRAPTKIEIITYTGLVDNGSTVTLTGVTKGVESTTDRAWLAGDHVYQSISKGVVDTFATDTQGTKADTALQPNTAITVTTIDTGQGAVECYAMDQATTTNSAVTFSTVTAKTSATIGASGVANGSAAFKRSSDGLTVGTIAVDSANSQFDISTAYSYIQFTTDTGEKLMASPTGINVTGSIAVTGTVDGRDIAADGTKLDGIEAGADVTDSTNVLASLAGQALAVATIDTGNGAVECYAMDQAVRTTDNVTFNDITVTGTVDGRDVATDGTKLDGIEAGADVTDSTNVVSALSNATLVNLGTPAVDDKILVQDSSDSNSLKYVPASSIGGDIGTITYSLDDLTLSGLFVLTGMTYLQSEYPDLFNIIGIGKTIPNTRDSIVFAGNSTSISIPYNIHRVDDQTYIVIGASTANDQDRIALFEFNGSTFNRINNSTAFDTLPVRYGGSGISRNVNGLKRYFVLPNLVSGTFGFIVYERVLGYYQTITSQTSSLQGCVAINEDENLIAFAMNQSANAIMFFGFNGSTLTNLTAGIDTNITTGVLSRIDFNSGYVAVGHTNGFAWYSVIGGGTGLKKLINGSGLASSSSNITSVKISPNGQFLAVCSSVSPYIEIYTINGETMTSIGTPTGAVAVVDAKFSDNSDFFAIIGGTSFRTWTITGSTFTRVDNLNANPASSSSTLELSSNRDIAFLAEGSNISMYKGFYPFNTSTEFYVPDVNDLSPQSIGDWQPGVTGKAYVRAK